MTPPIPNRSSRNLIFVSYAYEDQAFAKWLARKLAFFGYGVWIDQIKILGGESWVDEVEEAISEKSIRVLAILSKDSIKKPNPKKERTKALAVGKKLGITDFMMTLNIDGTEPDWTISDISYISFKDSWAQGLRRILKKLQAVNAPRIHAENAGLVAQSLEIGSKLLEPTPEPIFCNWLPIGNLPETLKVFKASGLTQDEIRSWPNYELSPDRLAAFFAPAAGLGAKVSETSEGYFWPDIERIQTHDAQHVVTRILNRAVDQLFRAAGIQFCRESKLYYIPKELKGEQLVRYVDTDGKSHHIKTQGNRKIRKPAGPPEVVIHRPAVRFRARRTAEKCYVVELIPALALFDSSGQPITGKAVGPRRKKVTQGWFNQAWRRRFLLFAQILREQSLASGWGHLEIGEPLSFSADHTLREDRLVRSSTDDEENESEIIVGIEELEEWVS